MRAKVGGLSKESALAIEVDRPGRIDENDLCATEGRRKDFRPGFS
jgi:hypothetical protein